MTEHAAQHATVGDLLWPVLNFAIFVAVLVRFLRPPAVEYFRARAARLREALQAGTRARAEAEALRATLARDVEHLPALRSQLRADLRAPAGRSAGVTGRLGKRYARAVLALAREDGTLEATGEELNRAAATFDEPRLRPLVLSPVIDAAARLRTARGVAEALGLSATVRNLSGLLAERDRLAIL